VIGGEASQPPLGVILASVSCDVVGDTNVFFREHPVWCFFCGFRLSEVALAEIRKPQVAGSIPVADSIALRKLNRNGSSVAGGISNRLLCHAVLEGSKLTNRGSTILSRRPLSPIRHLQ